jgi:N-acetylmuramic acid 6-phosphate etherase
MDQAQLKTLSTEGRNQNTLQIDTASAEEIVRLINNEDKTVAYAVEKALPQIAKAVEAANHALSNGGRVIYCGAGTSGRLGVLDASECRPTYGVDDNTVVGLIAGGKDAMFTAKEGAEDMPELCVADLKEIGFTKQDVLVGIAASGRTPYCIGGLEYANALGAVTVSVCCSKDSKMSKLAQIPIEAVTGPEAVTGSTRMKAGTAQKMILNIISTATMILQGKVYQNLMVDVQPTNEKLRVRARNILMQATGVSEEQAAKLLDTTSYKVKPAIVMELCGLSFADAQKLLDQNGGHIGRSIAACSKVRG